MSYQVLSEQMSEVIRKHLINKKNNMFIDNVFLKHLQKFVPSQFRAMIFYLHYVCIADFENNEINDIVVLSIPDTSSKLSGAQILAFSVSNRNFLQFVVEQVKILMENEKFDKMFVYTDEHWISEFRKYNFIQDLRLILPGSERIHMSYYFDTGIVSINLDVKPEIGHYYSTSKVVDNKFILVSDLDPQITYSLNSSGERLWHLIEDNKYSIAEIVKILSDFYSQDYQVVLKDVLVILERLWINGFVKWRESENPFAHKYIKKMDSDLQCEQIWIDKVYDIFTIKNSEQLYSDALISDIEFSDKLRIAKSIFHKNLCLYALKNRNGKLLSHILLQLDRVNLICYVLQFSYNKAISYGKMQEFIAEAISQMKNFYGFTDLERKNLVTLFNSINKLEIDAELNRISFSYVGTLPKESKEGDVYVYRFDVPSVQHIYH